MEIFYKPRKKKKNDGPLTLFAKKNGPFYEATKYQFFIAGLCRLSLFPYNLVGRLYTHYVQSIN